MLRAHLKALWAIAIASLVISLVAVAVAGYTLAKRSPSDGETHRCGALDGVYRCVGGDTPEDYVERGCSPLVGEGGVVVWKCER